MTTSGSCSAISFSRPRAPSQVAEVVEEPAGRGELGDQPVLDVEQPGHPAEGDLGAVAERPAAQILPIASRPLAISTSASGTSSSRSALMIRAGRSWPSPMSAVRTSTRGGALLGASGAGEQRAGGVFVAVQRGLFAGDRVGRAGRAAHPLDVLADAFLEARLGFPAELLERALVGDRLAGEVAGARRRVDDLAGRRCFPAPARRFRGSSRPRRRRGCRCGRRPRARARRRSRRRGPRRR